ncbi:hypothetical protein BCR43DRAFT_498068 [Syncephalastrum racemosum]|uniref:GYF domain-containing protein n=1 Tax=Syncephalastrum racemosum TaxID=13706 RepID=A0A1X2H390_SYNRA|nr:hypothetical protein BCR43DRAFT_498068 [Syncephalastrum racemosum]
MTTNMNFGPEWMRGTIPKRTTTLDAQDMRSLAMNTAAASPHGYPSLSNDAGHGHSLGSDYLPSPNEESGDSNAYRYSKDFMLSLYKPVDLPAELERHDYVAVPDSQGPLSFVELSEEEKKILSGPVHSEVSRRMVSSGDRSNSQRNHRDLYGSPMQSPASENTPSTPGRMTASRSKGYFSKDRDQMPRRSDLDDLRQHDWSDGLGAPSPGKNGDVVDDAWSSVNREAVGSFDANGMFRLGGTGSPLDGKLARDWQGDTDLGVGGKETRAGSRNFRHQADSMLMRDSFGVSAANVSAASAVAAASPFKEHASFNGLSPDVPLEQDRMFKQQQQQQQQQLQQVPQQPLRWVYRDPQGNIQGPFEAQEMQEWYKAGFFSPSLLVKREDDAQFEPLLALIRRLGNEEEPFLTPAVSTPLGGTPMHESPSNLHIGLPPTRGIDPFNRGPSSSSSMFGASDPANGAGLFRNQSQPLSTPGSSAGLGDFNKYYPLGGNGAVGGVSSFLQQQMGNPASPQSPSRLQDSFGGFGPSILGQRDTPSPWEKPRAPAWLNNGGQNDLFGADPAGISPLLQRQQQAQQHAAQQQQQGINPLFMGNMGPAMGGMGALGAGAMGSPGLFDYQRAMNEQLEQHQQYIQLLQQKQQEHLQLQQQLQQHLQQQAQQVQQVQQQPQQHVQQHQAQQPQQQQIPVESMAQPSHTYGVPSPAAQSPYATPAKVASPKAQPASAKAQTNGWDSAPGTPASSKKTSERDTSNKASEWDTSSSVPGWESPSKVSSGWESPKQAKQNAAEPAQETTDALADTIAETHISEPEPEPVVEQPAPRAPSPKKPAAKPVSLREIQAEEMRKQEQAKQEQRQQAAAAAAAAAATNGQSAQVKTGWSTGSAWGGPVSKGPSLREIQEMEAKEAEARKQAAEAQAAAMLNSSGSNDAPSSLSWGVVVPNKGSHTPTSTSSTAPAWGTTAAPKKTLREIQQEEEVAMKRRAKQQQQQQQQQQAATSASSMASSLSNHVKSGYAGIATSAAATDSPGPGWTTVTNARTTPKTPSTTAAPPASTPSSTMPRSSSGWDTVGAPRAAPQPAPVSQPRTPVKVEGEPKAPSEDFRRWCRHSLRGLNDGVHAEDIMMMLQSFPLNNSSAEIIQDIIYSNSTSMDGRRFAQEYMKRRKADLAGKLNVTMPVMSPALEDESEFKVVTKKGKKKTQV